MDALRDLSAAIHLDPNGSQAFYHRACLLRRYIHTYTCIYIYTSVYVASKTLGLHFVC